MIDLQYVIEIIFSSLKSKISGNILVHMITTMYKTFFLLFLPDAFVNIKIVEILNTFYFLDPEKITNVSETIQQLQTKAVENVHYSCSASNKAGIASLSIYILYYHT